MSNPRLQQFSASLIEEVIAKSGIDIDAANDDNFNLREEAFTEYILELLSEHNEADGVELAYYEARGTRSAPAAKINAWSLSGDGATADLFIVLYHGANEVIDVGLPVTRNQFQLARGFLARALNGHNINTEDISEGGQVMQRLSEAKDSLTTVRIFFLTDGVVRSLDLEEESFPGLEVRYVVWDSDKLSRLKVGDREVIELDFAHDYDGAIPCLKNSDPTGEYQTFLAFFPAPVLARIYGTHGQRLLERNVRAFLQSKGKINKGLQKTLKDEPHRFLAYNNGLCCTASDVRVKNGELEWVKDFQIVNGGQTTASIYHALKKEKVDISQVVVQVKLTVLSDPSKISEIVPLISRYANSQNKVNGADFAANGQFHQTLEQLSRSICAPPVSGLQRGTYWYYERARGSYADDKARQSSPALKRKWELENPTAQKFAKTDLAKYEHAWLGLPHFVCAGAEKNFNKFAMRMEEDGEPIVDLNYFKQLIAKAILFRTTEKIFSSLNLVGLRANSVAYAIGLLAHRSNLRIDLNRIWNDQRISSPLVEALKIACIGAYEFIINSQGDHKENTKKSDFWQAFLSSDINLPNEWEGDWAVTSFIAPNNEEDALSAEWEKVRLLLLNDNRTILAMEAYTNREWVPKYRRASVATLAAHDWKSLKKKPGIGLKKLRTLVEMFAIAAADL
jgi:hypothetical protein